MVDCTTPVSPKSRETCIRVTQLATCPELPAKRNDIVKCGDVPGPSCDPFFREPEEREPEQICMGVSADLFLCKHSSSFDECAYRQVITERCLAVTRSEEEWNAIADCMDPVCDPKTNMCEFKICDAKVECLRQYGLE